MNVSWRIGERERGMENHQSKCEELFNQLKRFEMENPDAPRRVSSYKYVGDSKYTVTVRTQKVSDDCPRVTIMKVKPNTTVIEKVVLDVYSLSYAVICASNLNAGAEDMKAVEAIAAELPELLKKALG